ncbi:MAG: hypothetical protein GF313_07815 [Caldithrix sp.]|nr:hypothetical protein [Caldithrix sp.]
MKRLTLTLLTSFFLVFFSATFLQAGESAESKVNWDQYSKRLVQAVKSDNEGLKHSAMRMIVRYADKVNASAARYAVMDEFLNSDDTSVRRLALVTLDAINNPFDLGYLERQLKFEKNPTIKRHIAGVLVANGRAKVYPKYEVVDYAVF